MPTYSTYEERKCYVESLPYLSSKRIVYYFKVIPNLRLVSFNYKLSTSTQRSIFFQTNPLVSEISCLIESPKDRLTSTRFCFTEKPEKRYQERLVYFIPNASLILSSVKVVAPFRYKSDRKVVYSISPCTNRTISFPVLVSNDRKIFFYPFHKIEVSTPTVGSSFRFTSERFIFFDTGKKTQRFITLAYSGHYTERNVFIQANEFSYVSTPVVTTSFKEEPSERVITTRTYIPHSERSILLTTIPFTDRQIAYPPVRLPSERSVFFQVSQFGLLDAVLILQAKLKYSERFCLTKGFVYASNRHIFVEQRETIFYKEKKVASSTDIQLVELEQKESIGKIITETDTEIHSDKGKGFAKDKKESLDRVDTYVLFDAGETVKVSPVSNLKGTLFSYKDSKKKVRKAITTFELRVAKLLEDERYSLAKPGPRWDIRTILSPVRYLLDRSIYAPYRAPDDRNLLIVKPYSEKSERTTKFNYGTKDSRDILITNPYSEKDTREICLHLRVPSERNIYFIYLALDERTLLFQLPYAVAVSDSGRIYKVYYDSSDGKLVGVAEDSSGTKGSRLTDLNKTSTYELVFDENNGRVTAKEIDASPENISPPIVLDYETRKQKYELYYDKTNGKLTLIKKED